MLFLLDESRGPKFACDRSDHGPTVHPFWLVIQATVSTVCLIFLERLVLEKTACASVYFRCKTQDVNIAKFTFFHNEPPQNARVLQANFRGFFGNRRSLYSACGLMIGESDYQASILREMLLVLCQVDSISPKIINRICGMVPFLLVFIRIAAVLLTAPILGSRHVPWRFRLLLAFFIALAVLPLAQSTDQIEPTRSAQQPWLFQFISTSTPSIEQLPQLLPLFLAEIIVGTSLGLGVTILVVAAKTAGSILGQLAGLQWPTQPDQEAGEPISALSQLFGLVSLATFVLIGGPELVLASFIESFQSLPIGIDLELERIPQLLTVWLQQSFLLTLRGVAPAVTALMISNLTLGMIGRSYPQINILGLNIQLNQLVLLTFVMATMGGCVWLFVDDLELELQAIVVQLRSLLG